jgi:hypothetical protein
MEDFKTPIEDYYKRNGIRDQGSGAGGQVPGIVGKLAAEI